MRILSRVQLSRIIKLEIKTHLPIEHKNGKFENRVKIIYLKNQVWSLRIF